MTEELIAHVFSLSTDWWTAASIYSKARTTRRCLSGWIPSTRPPRRVRVVPPEAKLKHCQRREAREERTRRPSSRWWGKSNDTSNYTETITATTLAMTAAMVTVFKWFGRGHGWKESWGRRRRGKSLFFLTISFSPSYSLIIISLRCCS